ncbi:hypothetical protein HAX54_048621 [Datura stramonium]|uniref:Uncharacterized protein n=1 Tax=Datura stramonium TaxID=4076 RepID=A0ABS8WJH1_DATST|nr:hypothetical protein [Datura stramonium]
MALGVCKFNLCQREYTMGRKGKGGGRGRDRPQMTLITTIRSSISARINGASLDPTSTIVTQVMQQSLAGTTLGSAKSPNPNLDLLLSGRSGLISLEQFTESME